MTVTTMTSTWVISGDADRPGSTLVDDLRAGDRRRVVVVPDQERVAAGAVDEAVAGFGRIDVLVSCVGPLSEDPIDGIALDGLERQMAASLWGTIHLVRAALPVMQAQGGGHIIAVLAGASGAAGAYRTASAAVAAYMEALAEAVRPAGIAVTIVETGGPAAVAPAEALVRLAAMRRPPVRMHRGRDPLELAEIGACSVRCEQYGR
jgi:NAD(P)-dependent dehydrogenase (short-subunit alcohol dehydrogenase family)